MADAVATRTLASGSKRSAFLFSNLSDGTGETSVQKVDISTLNGAPSKVSILRAMFNISGMTVKVSFDHTTDDDVLYLSGVGEIDLREFGGLKDPASAGGTGDILFSTIGAALNNSYNIMLEIGS